MSELSKSLNIYGYEDIFTHGFLKPKEISELLMYFLEIHSIPVDLKLIDSILDLCLNNELFEVIKEYYKRGLVTECKTCDYLFNQNFKAFSMFISQENDFLCKERVSLHVIKDKTLTSHTNIVWCIDISANQKFIATASEDKTVIIWNYDTFEMVHILHDHNTAVMDLTFSSDDRYLATCSNVIIIYDLHDFDIVSEFTEHEKSIKSLSFSKDSKYLVSGDAAGVIKTWDLSQTKSLKTFTLQEGFCWRVLFSPNDDLIGVLPNTENAYLISRGSFEVSQKFEGHTQSITSICFNSNGSIVATGSIDETVKLWHLMSGECIQTFDNHGSTITGLKFFNEDQKLLVSTMYGKVYIWDVQTQSIIREIQTELGNIMCIAMSEDESTIVFGGNQPSNVCCMKYLSDYQMFKTILDENISNVGQYLIDSRETGIIEKLICEELNLFTVEDSVIQWLINHGISLNDREFNMIKGNYDLNMFIDDNELDLISRLRNSINKGLLDEIKTQTTDTEKDQDMIDDNKSKVHDSIVTWSLEKNLSINEDASAQEIFTKLKESLNLEIENLSSIETNLKLNIQELTTSNEYLSDKLKEKDDIIHKYEKQVHQLTSLNEKLVNATPTEEILEENDILKEKIAELEETNSDLTKSVSLLELQLEEQNKEVEIDRTLSNQQENMSNMEELQLKIDSLTTNSCIFEQRILELEKEIEGYKKQLQQANIQLTDETINSDDLSKVLEETVESLEKERKLTQKLKEHIETLSQPVEELNAQQSIDSPKENIKVVETQSEQHSDEAESEIITESIPRVDVEDDMVEICDDFDSTTDLHLKQIDQQIHEIEQLKLEIERLKALIPLATEVKQEDIDDEKENVEEEANDVVVLLREQEKLLNDEILKLKEKIEEYDQLIISFRKELVDHESRLNLVSSQKNNLSIELDKVKVDLESQIGENSSLKTLFDEKELEIIKLNNLFEETKEFVGVLTQQLEQIYAELRGTDEIIQENIVEIIIDDIRTKTKESVDLKNNYEQIAKEMLKLRHDLDSVLQAIIVIQTFENWDKTVDESILVQFVEETNNQLSQVESLKKEIQCLQDALEGAENSKKGCLCF
eukprot:TRINITY_DN11978_c0_g1_i1.p1 TRINITY_DN11978_c0_g1~~TRINITY_DN11978_c0_g1_i1.p1  ORF type:complete len:1095 (+),score=374.83 TRINITY_DN11978_c0_g1_i1:38-3322(+)